MIKILIIIIIITIVIIAIFPLKEVYSAIPHSQHLGWGSNPINLYGNSSQYRDYRDSLKKIMRKADGYYENNEYNYSLFDEYEEGLKNKYFRPVKNVYT
jgi:hypothetical protein